MEATLKLGNKMRVIPMNAAEALVEQYPCGMKNDGWYGNSDASTSASAFDYHVGGNNETHIAEFAAVKQRIEELLQERDGNDEPVIQLIYTRLLGEQPVLAYRWTSDWAYRKFEHELIRLGGSLGRGVFEPFKGDNYSNWFPKK